MDFDGSDEAKEEAICFGCHLFDTKPGKNVFETEFSDEEINDLVDEIEDITSWENAGFATDWTLYSFDHKLLVKIRRETEKNIENIRQNRMQAFLKGWFG